MRRLAVLLVPLLMLACDEEPMEPDPNAEFSLIKSDKYSLVGQGSWTWDFLGTEYEVQFMISASGSSDGQATGRAILVKPIDPVFGTPMTGKVIGITPPTLIHQHWCIEVEIPDDPGEIGRVCVEDHDGETTMDRIAGVVEADPPPGTCAEYPDPGVDDWSILKTGDYRGTIKTH